MTVIYGVAAVLSLGLAIAYCNLLQKKEIWIILLHVAVLVVNVGYFLQAFSKTLEGALFANRVSYLGSVFLPLCMLITIMKICRIGYNKIFLGCLIGISVIVFLIAASGGWLDIYYQSVSIKMVNGSARLVKEYGPLHCLYYVYLFTYFLAMAGVILFSALKKDGTPHKLAMFLAAIVLGNVGIWLVEQLIDVDFEFLSISYVITEVLILLLYCILQDAELEQMENEVPLAEKEEMLPVTEAGLQKEKDLPDMGCLTARELEVLSLILKNKKRKEIAEELQVSENTIKKHTSHIFSKLEVSNRKELFEKIG